MPLGELLHALKRDADAEVRAITAAGAAEVARIDAASTCACTDRLAIATRAFTDELQAAADADLATVERRTKRDVLVARAAMLERIRDAIRAELPPALDRALATRLLDAALAYAGPGTVRCAPDVVVPPRADLTVVVDPSVTGVVLELANGTRIDATLDALLERAWPRLAAEALVLVEEGT